MSSIQLSLYQKTDIKLPPHRFTDFMSELSESLSGEAEMTQRDGDLLTTSISYKIDTGIVNVGFAINCSHLDHIEESSLLVDGSDFDGEDESLFNDLLSFIADIL
ncbi:hypothetical protein ACQR3P_28865 [Rhodococcus sp. IEGM1300]